MPSPSTSLFDRSPFRTSTRRVASCSIIIARSSSSKLTTWRGSSFSVIVSSPLEFSPSSAPRTRRRLFHDLILDRDVQQLPAPVRVPAWWSGINFATHTRDSKPNDTGP